MKKRLNFLPALLLLLLLCGATAAQNTPTADEILDRSEEQLKGKSSKGEYTMRVVTPDYTRSFTMQSWWVEENDKALIKIIAPKREAGNKTLKIGNEIWMYLRNTETTVKIPPSMMLQSWNGSDYTFDDLVRESSLRDDYDVSLLGSETAEGAQCWKLSLKPHDDAPVVWGVIEYWVRSADFLPAKILYYDEKNVLVRSQVFRDYAEAGGRKIPRTWIMRDELKPGHSTEMSFNDVEFDIEIPDNIFSFQALER